MRFRVQPADVEELTEGEPAALVMENARRKADAVEGEMVPTVLAPAEPPPVLGVDTAVVMGGAIYGKPADAGQAAASLRRLSGETHEVWGGIALGDRVAHAVTEVRFRDLDQHDIDWYLETGEWRARAGGYAIQGRGAALVEGIRGDFWNVVGLPVAELVRIAPQLLGIRP